MVSGRRLWLVVAVVGAVVGGGLAVPPLAVPVAAAAAVDDDVSVAGRGVAAEPVEPGAEDATAVTAPDGSVPVWPEAGSAVVDVPRAAGADAGVTGPADRVPVVAAVPGVSVLADGGAAVAVRPGDVVSDGGGGRRTADPAGPGAVARDGQRRAPGGLPAGGLSRVRVVGSAPAVARGLGAAQVFTVNRVDGSVAPSAVDVRVDYSGYAGAFGGSYADRLRLVRLPACALSAPALPECAAPVPVEAVNDAVAGTLTARVAVAGDAAERQRVLAGTDEEGSAGSGAVFAVMSSGSGSSTGDYTATDLGPGGTWQVGLSSGSFTYSYPVPAPPLAAGSGLGLSLSYDSQSLDAFTQSTNNQSGWAGLGWNLSPGFIERKYRPCSEDVGDGSPKERADQEDWGELCWESPDENDGESDTTDATNSELYLSLNGVSTRIVKDRVSGQWRTEQDFGWKLELIEGGSGKDYWIISTLDGARYRFGYTDASNLWVPAVGDDPGEPYYSSYPTSYKQTWRWMLDRVRDRNENVTTLVWTEESNFYKRLMSGNILEYDRAAYLDRIEYGENSSASAVPTGKVEFTSIDRCVEATVRADPVADPYPSGVCPPVTAANAASYPDVPVDLKCSSSSCGVFTPTFFSDKRLDIVTTHEYRVDTASWANIYRLHLAFKTVNPSGLTGEVLWLDRIFPVGLIGADADKVRLPGLDFGAAYLEGRVDHGESEYGVSRMLLPRVNKVYNGYGGRTDVTYGHVAPCPSGGSGSGNDAYWDWYDSKVGNWDVNTDECAPVWFKPVGSPAGWGQFHKYLALTVVDKDLVAGSPDVTTSYEYLGDAAWALGYGFIDAQGLTESWNEWRGYPRVRVTTGSGTDPDGYSMSEHTFFRGLYYDFFDDWSTQRLTKITSYDGDEYSDFPGKASKPLQVRHYRMTGYDADPADRTYSEVASSRFTYLWDSTGDGPGWRNPHYTHRYYQRDRVKIAAGWRETSVETTFDPYGLPTEVVDNGEIGISDNTCTSISYARRDLDDWYLMDYPETVRTWDTATCGSGELISMTESFYDGYTTIGAQSPFDGNVTAARVYTSAAAYTQTGASFDDYGRVTATTDAAGQTTTVTYDPPVGFPAAGITTTNPAGHTTTALPARSHGQVHRVFDANGTRVDITYDQLGRPIEVFGPGDPESAGIPSMTFDYKYTWDGGAGYPTAPVRVGTHTLRGKTSGGQYLASYAFDDGLGRLLETQTASPAGGRVVAATYHDGRGLARDTSAPFHNTGAAGSGLVNAAVTALPSWTRTEYDALGRPVVVAARALSAELWRTTTTYGGDHVTVTPPAGAQPSTVFSDVRGNTTLRQQHRSGGGSVDTSYEWDLESQLLGVVDDAGNEWSYTYDLAGRKTAAVDPDTGTTTYAYDSAGRLAATTDARGETVTTSYDVLSRPVTRWHGPAGTGTKLAEWVYDTLLAGQLTSATRWHDGHAYTTTVTGYNARYQPTGSTVMIPAVEGSLAGSYAYSYGYTDAGWQQSTSLPAAGGLPAETVTTSYTSLGLVAGLSSGLGGGTTYVAETSYDKTGDLIQQLLGASGSRVARDLAWNEATGRLDAITTMTGADTAAPATVQDDSYTYDPVGNVLSIVDAVAAPAGQAQCFDYDDLRRLVAAWTTTSAACSAGPSSGAVDGPDPYWHSWTFDSVGNRLTQVEHAVAGLDPVSTTYTYPPAGGPRPHAVTGRSVTDAAGTVVTGYAYDAAGHTTSRPGSGSGGQQTLTWDPEGHLAAVTDEDGSGSYVYDDTGNRLVAHHGDGTSVLYLPGGMEIHADAVGMTSAYRYYGGIAVRTSGGGLSWLAADHHNTGTLSIDADTGDVTRRRSDPYGNPRGAVNGGVWPDDKGFLGAPADPTGLTHLGAREYDPLIGRFISVDPIMDLTDPQQMHGYTYANANPLSFTDPDGLEPYPWHDQNWASKSSKERDTITESHLAGERQARAEARNRSRDRQTARRGGGGGRGGATGESGSADSSGKSSPGTDGGGLRCPSSGCFTTTIDETARSSGRACQSYTCAPRCVDGGAWDCEAATFWEVMSLLTVVVSVGIDVILIVDPIPGDEVVAGAGQVRLVQWQRAQAAAARSRVQYCSFAAQTPVLMADGTTKPISDVEVGDQVWATDPETGEAGSRTVTHLWIHDDTLVDLVLEGSETITTTEDHPFWNHTDQQWQPANALDVGDQLVGVNDNYVTVVGTDYSSARITTAHNLTVADLHTYFVVAGSSPVLVHNVGCGANILRVNVGAVPEKVVNVLNRVDAKNAPFPGYKGGRDFVNDGGQGASILPRGSGVTYKEWDVNPWVKGTDRGGERLVTGTDGTAWYTTDHYHSFYRVR
jgi:RHS repeat-associated protein